jgi:hypothetical protein
VNRQETWTKKVPNLIDIPSVLSLHVTFTVPALVPLVSIEQTDCALGQPYLASKSDDASKDPSSIDTTSSSAQKEFDYSMHSTLETKYNCCMSATASARTSPKPPRAKAALASAPAYKLGLTKENAITQTRRNASRLMP